MTSDKGTKRTSESSAPLPILQILACACEFVTFRGLTESMHEASCFGRARAGRKSGKRDAGLMARATRCGTRPRQIGQLHETYFKCLWSVWRPCRKNHVLKKKVQKNTSCIYLHIFLHIFCYMHLNIFKCSQPAAVTHSMLVSPVLFLSCFGCGPFSGLWARWSRRHWFSLLVLGNSPGFYFWRAIYLGFFF